MRKILLFNILLSVSTFLLAQPASYYNGTAGLKGDDLKTTLHEIINDHVDFSYSQARYLINYSDADPTNENNVILFYTQRSQAADTYGTDGNSINREHVWAKSHGGFADMRPMDGDAFNLRPADASVNIDRSNRDFGNVNPDGTQHDEATSCWYSKDLWEPGDASKGQVARILFYMATRYEGDNGEIDLEVVNGYNTYPNPEHGDLATLLEWNRQFPPTDFEKRRNERIFESQQNRNPFIDNPYWADLIWAEAEVNPIQFNAVSMSPLIPNVGESVTINFTIETELELDDISIFWGAEVDAEDDEITLDETLKTHEVTLPLGNFKADDYVYFKVTAKAGDQNNKYYGSFQLPQTIDASELTSLTNIQGTGNDTPLDGKRVTIAGRIVGNFDNTIYVQYGTEKRSALCIYGSNKTGYIGDSIVATGDLVEYNNLTELTNISYFYNFANNAPIEATVIKANEIGEDYEGMLVTIKNVIFNDAGVEVPDANSSYIFSDDAGTGTVFFRYGSRMVNKQLPLGITDVTGVVSQYQNTYQLLPRDQNDFSAGEDNAAPTVASLKVVDKSWITIEFSERVEQESAENLDNYKFNNNITVYSAYRYPGGKTVILNIEGLTIGTHKVTISNISDMSGNLIAETEIEFESEYTNIEEFARLGLQIFPNPIQDGSVSIRSNNAVKSIQLLSVAGKKLQDLDPSNTNHQLNQAKGVYILNITFIDDTTVRSKLVIQ